MKRYSPTGRRNHGRPVKRLLDTWDRNGPTSGPTPWQKYDDDDELDYDVAVHKQQARFISSRSPCHLGVLFGDIDGLLERQRCIQLVAAGDTRSSRPSYTYLRRSRFNVMCHDSQRCKFSALFFFNYRASLVTQRTSSCTANQFQLSWVPKLTWPTATIHGNKRNTYVSCPCAPYESTWARGSIDALIKLGTIWS
jgi:hypothetical protein